MLWNLTLAAAAAVGALEPAQAEVHQLAWLQGHWRTEVEIPHTGAQWTEELWSEPAAGTMLGVGRTIGNLATQSFEYMRIAREPGGTIAFYGSPNGGPAVRFGLARAAPNAVTFEKRDHDYPQRITYRREGDRLIATISLIDGSRAVSWTFLRQAPAD